MLATNINGTVGSADISDNNYPCFDMSSDEVGVFLENFQGWGTNGSYLHFENEETATRYNVTGQSTPQGVKNNVNVGIEAILGRMPTLALNQDNMWSKLYKQILAFCKKYAFIRYGENIHQSGLWKEINVGYVLSNGVRVYAHTRESEMSIQDCFYFTDLGDRTKIISQIEFITNSDYTADGCYMFPISILNKYGVDGVLLPVNEQKRFFGVAILNTNCNTPNNITGRLFFSMFTTDTLSYLLDEEVTIDTKEIDEIYGEYSSTGGYSGGNFDGSSDNIGHPNDPPISYVQQGMGNLYKVENLREIVNELYPKPTFNYDIDHPLESIAECINAIYETFDNKNLMDFVVDCIALPVSPTTYGVQGIKVGHKTLETTGRPLSSEYINFDCGTISVKEYYKNFIDYTGTSFQLFLVGYGFVEIPPEYIQDGSLNVRYKFNAITGEFVATILSKSSKSSLNSVIGQYTGNMCVHMPINGMSYGEMLQATLNSASGVASSAINGSLVGMADNAMSAISASPTPKSSNAYSGGASYMGLRTPFLLICRDKAHFSKSYPHDIGIPCNISYKLGNIQGYTECELDGFKCENATQEERDEIANLLRGGVIL